MQCIARKASPLTSRIILGLERILSRFDYADTHPNCVGEVRGSSFLPAMADEWEEGRALIKHGRATQRERWFIATGAFRGEGKSRPRACHFTPPPVQESALDAPSMAD